MEIMLKKFCKKYKLPEKSLFELLSHMEEISFSKGELIIEKGERNSNFYLIKKGIWRAYYLADGTENSLWFATPGDSAFSSGCTFDILSLGKFQLFYKSSNE